MALTDDGSSGWVMALVSILGLIMSVITGVVTAGFFAGTTKKEIEVLKERINETRDEIDKLRRDREQLRADIRHDVRQVMSPVIGQITDLSKQVINRVVESMATGRK